MRTCFRILLEMAPWTQTTRRGWIQRPSWGFETGRLRPLWQVFVLLMDWMELQPRQWGDFVFWLTSWVTGPTPSFVKDVRDQFGYWLWGLTAAARRFLAMLK